MYSGICGNCPVIVNIPANIDDDIIMNRAFIMSKSFCRRICIYLGCHCLAEQIMLF